MTTHRCIPEASRRWTKEIRKKLNFFTKESTGIGMEIGKGEDLLIKHNIARDVHTTNLRVKTFVPFMKWAIAYENALSGAKSQFARIIRPKMRPYRTTKGA